MDLKKYPPLLDIPELVEVLRVSERTVWKIINNGLPTVRVGRKVLVEKEELKKWVKENTEVRNSDPKFDTPAYVIADIRKEIAKESKIRGET